MALTFLDSSYIDGTLQITSIANSASDTDMFLVSDGGVLKYRTGAQVRSDIGAGTGNGTVTSVAVSAGTGLSGGGTITTSGTISLGLDLGELTIGGTLVGTDYLIAENGGVDNRQLISSIPLSIFSNNLGWTSNAGTVTSVATSAPLTGGTITGSGTIGISQSSATTDGYLSSTDWTTFNNKTSNTGTVTSVGISAGTGMSGGGTITTSGTVTLTNADRGSSQNIFKNIAVSGQTSIVADNNNDTLTFAAGSNITLTTDATTDTLTITANINPGDITGVTATAPLTGGGTSGDVTIGIPVASSTANGYLSSTDWTTFNNKTSNTGTVTSVAATNGTGISISGSPITSSGTLTITNTAPNVSTNLSTTTSATTLTVVSSDGTNAVLPASTQTVAGVMTADDKKKLDGIATGATNVTNNNQLTNGAGYITASSTDTLTNKSGNISQWTNDSGYTTNVGDITGVTAGTGISGGGTSGTVTITNSDRGSSQNIFKNFAVSGQTTIVADSNNDTLTLAAGSNITLTTDATTDTLTITANINPGDITGVTATAPLTGGGTSGDVTIGIPAASSTVNGYLSSTDWTTFNNKTSNTGTVTSVATGGGLTGGTITGSGTISHADTSTQASVNNSGLTFIQDVTLDTYGHVTGLASATVTLPTVNNSTITLAAGTGMSGGGSFTTNQSAAGTVTFNADDVYRRFQTISVAGQQPITSNTTADTLSFRPLGNISITTDPATNTLTINGSGGSGTVTSVAATAGTGISISGSPITTSGTLTITNTAPDTGVPAILSNGTVPSLNTGITGAEVRSLIGAGTGSGTVTSVGIVAGTGMSGGGTITSSGSVTLNCTIDTPAEVGLGNLSSNGNNLSGDFTATGNITAYSDERLKTDVETISNALEKVNSLRGVSYTKDGVRGLGVIAQEIEKVLPEVVLDGEEFKSVAYGNIVGVLIEAIKELTSEVEELKKQMK